MLVEEDVLICWMRRMRVVHLHASFVSSDLYVLSGDCERGEGLVPHSKPAEMLCVCQPVEGATSAGGLAGCCCHSLLLSPARSTFACQQFLSYQFSTPKHVAIQPLVRTPVPIQAQLHKTTLKVVASSTHCQRRAIFTRFWLRRRLLSPVAFHRGPKQPTSIVVVVVD